MTKDEIDVVAAAKEREGWMRKSDIKGLEWYVFGTRTATVGRIWLGDDADFIANAPRAIVALAAENVALKRELKFTENRLKETKDTNRKFQESWEAVIGALCGKEVENPLRLGAIQIAQAVVKERDELKAEVERLREATRWRDISTLPPRDTEVEGWCVKQKRPVIINYSLQHVDDESDDKGLALWEDYQDNYPVEAGGTISHWRPYTPPHEAEAKEGDDVQP